MKNTNFLFLLKLSKLNIQLLQYLYLQMTVLVLGLLAVKLEDDLAVGISVLPCIDWYTAPPRQLPVKRIFRIRYSKQRLLYTC